MFTESVDTYNASHDRQSARHSERLLTEVWPRALFRCRVSSFENFNKMLELNF